MLRELLMREGLRLRPSPSLKLWSSRLLQQPLNATYFISHEAPLHHQLIKLTDSQKKWSVNIIFRFVLLIFGFVYINTNFNPKTFSAPSSVADPSYIYKCSSMI